MKKKILITGAEGFIARNLSKYLHNRKFTLYGIGNKKFEENISKKFGYKFIINKNINSKILLNNFKNIDIVLHCAGTGVVNSSKNNIFQKNYLTTKSVIDYCKNLKKKPSIFFLSSYSVYETLPNKKITETHTLKPTSYYALTKLKSEKLLVKWSEKLNIHYTILRIASVYGNGLTKQLFFDACKKFLNKDSFFYGTGNEVRDWLHIDDFCSLVYKIIRANKNIPIINCGSGLGYSVKKVLNIIIKNFNPDLNIKFENRKNSPKFLVLDNNLAKKFKWFPKININKGLQNYTNWFKKNYD